MKLTGRTLTPRTPGFRRPGTISEDAIFVGPGMPALEGRDALLEAAPAVVISSMEEPRRVDPRGGGLRSEQGRATGWRLLRCQGANPATLRQSRYGPARRRRGHHVPPAEPYTALGEARRPCPSRSASRCSMSRARACGLRACRSGRRGWAGGKLDEVDRRANHARLDPRSRSRRTDTGESCRAVKRVRSRRRSPGLDSPETRPAAFHLLDAIMISAPRPLARTPRPPAASSTHPVRATVTPTRRCPFRPPGVSLFELSRLMACHRRCWTGAHAPRRRSTAMVGALHVCRDAAVRTAEV